MAINLNGKIGGVDKKYVAAGGVLVAGVLVIVYFRAKKQTSSASSSTTGGVTDPAGNVCDALDPNSGYCPGTPQDTAYQQSTLANTNAGSYVGGQVIGYDQYGNPIYSSSPTQTGVPGGFTNNAEWAQASQAYLTTNEPNADPGIIGIALGLYINGQGVTADQQQIIEQAIAFEGLPPVGGPGGFPPSIKTVNTPPPPPPGTAKPGPPSDITVDNPKSTANVSWKPGKNATSYNFGISPAPTGGSSGMHNIGARTQYNVSGIQKGKTYTITVTAQNSAGVSAAAKKSFKGA